MIIAPIPPAWGRKPWPNYPLVYRPRVAEPAPQTILAGKMCPPRHGIPFLKKPDLPGTFPCPAGYLDIHSTGKHHPHPPKWILMSSPLFAKVICFFFGHAYSTRSTAPDLKKSDLYSCYTFSKCTRCGNLDTPSRSGAHKFGEFAPHGNTACTLSRTCPNCGFTQTKVQHGQIKLVKTRTPCQLKQICIVCGEELGTTHSHVATHLVDSTKRCKQDIVCDQCCKVIGEKDHHDFGPPFEARIPVDPDDYYIGWAVKCKRCGFFQKA